MVSENLMDNSNKIALASEELAISKRVLEGDTLRVHVEAETDDCPVQVTTAREEITMETVVVGREVTTVPEIRTEGNVTIIPVFGEEARRR
jgi:stress response protein YsnF